MTQKLKLIGLTGPAGSGKDTVAHILVWDYAFNAISLAGPIREGIRVMLGIPRDFMTDRALKETSLRNAFRIDRTPRQLMQTLGTEWGRNMVDPDLWLKMAQTKIDSLGTSPSINGIVVSDIRFPSEAEWIRNQGGTIWHISRPGNPFAIESDHESETPLIPQDSDQLIINDGSIEKLAETVTNMMQDDKEAA